MSYLGDTSGFDEVEGSGFDSFYELNSVILFALRKRNGIYQIKVILDYDYTLDGVTTSFVAGQFALNAEGGLLSATSNAWIKPEILTYGVPNNIISELLSDTVGDREATAADVLLTHADVLLTHADVISARDSASAAEREALAATSTLDDVRQQVDNARGYEHGAEEARDAAAASATSAANALATITHPSRNLVDNGKGLVAEATKKLTIDVDFSQATWIAFAEDELVFDRWHRSSAPNEKYQYIPRNTIDGGVYTLRWSGGGNAALDGQPNLVNGSQVNLDPPNGVNGNVKLLLPTIANNISLNKGTGPTITTLPREDIAACHTYYFQYDNGDASATTGLVGVMFSSSQFVVSGLLPTFMHSRPAVDYHELILYGDNAGAAIVDSMNMVIRGHSFDMTGTITIDPSFPTGTRFQIYLQRSTSYLILDARLTG